MPGRRLLERRGLASRARAARGRSRSRRSCRRAAPARSASTSGCSRSGGFILNTGSKPAHDSSVSTRCCGVHSAVTRTPSAFAARTRSTDARARHVQHVVAAAGELREREVARHDRRLRLRGPARDPEPGRPRTFVHVAAAHERGIFGVLREHRAGQRAEVLERAAHHARVGHAVAVVGEHAHAEVVELAHRRELLAPPALRDATGDVHGAQPRARPRSSTDCTTAASSSGGSVFGMHTTAVHPPSAAARAPVSIVSASSRPGSRKCTWMSTRPGATTQPFGVEHRARRPTARARARPRRSRRRRRARRPTRSPVSSTTRPPCEQRASDNGTSRSDQRPQHGHAHRDPVGDLLGHERAGRSRRPRPRSRRRGSSGRGASRACRA